jgi:hypothetical protein
VVTPDANVEISKAEELEEEEEEVEKIRNFSCWSKPAFALDENMEISKAEEPEKTRNSLEDELEEKAASAAEQEVEKEVSTPWVLKPSVGTWLIPVHAREETSVEAGLGAFEISAPADSAPKAVSIAKVQKKGLGKLGAMAKTWFCCLQSSATEPKLRKVP